MPRGRLPLSSILNDGLDVIPEFGGMGFANPSDFLHYGVFPHGHSPSNSSGVQIPTHSV
jgi:hypothetical protein